MRRNKRQRKKIAKQEQKRAERMAHGFKEIGRIFADSALQTLKAPGFSFHLAATDEEYLAWENNTHPWWTRTKR